MREKERERDDGRTGKKLGGREDIKREKKNGRERLTNRERGEDRTIRE